MILAVPVTAILMLAMLMPYLPGRYDASAATVSFVIQVAGYASLLLVPVGIAWIVNRRRARLWHRVAFVLAGFLAFVTTLAAVSVNHLALGLLLGCLTISGIWYAHRRTPADLHGVGGPRSSFAISLASAPVVLVAFITLALPHAAEWSRDRAIRHSDALIAEIESFRERRGHYPVSLQSLNRDIPTGVVGIERFHYEPNGEGYNLYFVRQSIALDAMEVVMFNRRDEHRFASHELDILQYDGEQLERRRGDRRRTPLDHAHWISILFD
jgi:hypothetical protein